MNKKIKFLLLLIILAGISFIVYLKFSKPDSSKLKLEISKELFLYSEEIRFNYDPFGDRPKVVTYLKTQAANELKRYVPYITNYKNISFIFYFTDDNRSEIKRVLNEIELQVPVFFDLNSKNPNFSYLLITYVLDSENNILEIINPTIPGFEKMLISLNK